MPSLTNDEKRLKPLDVYYSKKLDYNIWDQTKNLDELENTVTVNCFSTKGRVVVNPFVFGSEFYNLAFKSVYCRFRVTGGVAGVDISRRYVTKKLSAPLTIFIYDTIGEDPIEQDVFNFHEDYLFNYEDIKTRHNASSPLYIYIPKWDGSWSAPQKEADMFLKISEQPPTPEEPQPPLKVETPHTKVNIDKYDAPFMV